MTEAQYRPSASSVGPPENNPEVKAADSVTGTYVANASTKVHSRATRAAASISDIKTGDRVLVTGTGTTTLTAVRVVEAKSWHDLPASGPAAGSRAVKRAPPRRSGPQQLPGRDRGDVRAHHQTLLSGDAPTVRAMFRFDQDRQVPHIPTADRDLGPLCLPPQRA